MGTRGPFKEDGPERRENVRLDKIDPEVMKKYKALEKALIHEFIDDHVDLRDRYLKKSLELQKRVFGEALERSNAKFRIDMGKEPPPVPPRTSTRLEFRRKSGTMSPPSEENDRVSPPNESPDEPDERNLDENSSRISVSFTDKSDHKERNYEKNRDPKDRESNRESRSRPRSSKPSERVKELSSDLFETISEKQQQNISKYQRKSPRRRKHSSDTITSGDSIAFSSRSSGTEVLEIERLPSGKSAETRVKNSNRRIIFADRSREGRRGRDNDSECSLHEVDQRHRQKKHNVTNISQASRWSSNRSRNLSPYRQRVSHTSISGHRQDASHEMSRHSAAISRHERSSSRTNYREVPERPLRQNSRARSSVARPKSSHQSFSHSVSNRSGMSPRYDVCRSHHRSLPISQSGGVSHRPEDTNEENISKWLELKEMEMAEDKWEKKARKLLADKKRHTDILNMAKREDDSKMAYDKWFKEKSRSIRSLEKKLSQTGIESAEKAELQSKNDECFKTWLRQKDVQKRKEREAERRRIERESTEEVRTEAERRKAFNDWLKNKERSLKTQQRKKKQLEREALAAELENLSSRSKESPAQETQNSAGKKISFLDEIVGKSDEENEKNKQIDANSGDETEERNRIEEKREDKKDSPEEEIEFEDSLNSDENEH